MSGLLNEGHTLGYLFCRETFNRGPFYKPVIDYQLEKTKGSLYRKNLLAHFGCINAIEFSNDGNLLASGGDDRRLLLWHVQKSMFEKEEPRVMQAEHLSNIFAVAFDCTKDKIISAGNDDQVILHDIATGNPLDYFVQEQPIFDVCADPVNNSIFATACDDGRILIYDIRESSSGNGELIKTVKADYLVEVDVSYPFCLVRLHSAFHSVMFNPLEPRIILTGNSKEGAALWDIRRPDKILLKFGRQSGEQCCMSARFNQNGTQVLALRRKLPPILYSTQSAAHLFQFNHLSYYNSCTMKSCSFAGPSDQYVMSGSDNFDIHLWKIPLEGSKQWVNEASVILKGHRSIVNQVRYNYAYDLIASSGVEKMVKLWSPFTLYDESAPEGIQHEPERKIFAHEEYIRLVTHSSQGQFMSIHQDSVRRSTEEDSRMMAFFDALVQRDIIGLSDADTDDSTYTNTVYSAVESSDEDDGSVLGGVVRSSPVISSVSTSQSQQLTSSQSQPLDNDSEENVHTIDIEDLPVVVNLSSEDSENENSNSSYVYSSQLSRAGNSLRSRQVTVEDQINANAEEAEADDSNDEALVVSEPEEPSPSNATGEPDLLTNLIVTKGALLRRRAVNKLKRVWNNQTHKSRPDNGRPCRTSASSSSDESDSSLESTPSGDFYVNSSRKLRRRLKTLQDSTHSAAYDSLVRLRERRESLQTTPVYDSSNNTRLTPPATDLSSYTLEDIIMNQIPDPFDNSATSDSDSSSSSSSSSSASSTSSSSSSSEKSESKVDTSDAKSVIYSDSSETSGNVATTESNRKRKILPKRSNISRHRNSCRKTTTTKSRRKSFSNIASSKSSNYSSDSSESESHQNEPPRKKAKVSRPSIPKKQRSSKKIKSKTIESKPKFGTPSDSGIEMSKTNEQEGQEPCSSKSCYGSSGASRRRKLQVLSDSDSENGVADKDDHP